MKDRTPYERLDPERLVQIQQAERPLLHVRWWLVLPLALVLVSAQSVLNLLFENSGRPAYLIATQISVIAFAFLFLLALAINPLIKLTRLLKPMNRAEMMTLFAALCVSAGISSFGLVEELLPLIAAPFNTQWNIPQAKWNVDIIPHLNRHLFITDTKIIEEFRQGFPAAEGLWRKIPWLVWAKPLGLWMIFVFSMYLAFYSLSMLLYDSWARREKLVFPLARVPELMMEDEGARPGALPSSLRSGLFWIGFLAVFGVLSFNAACEAGWIRGLHHLPLGMSDRELRPMLENSIFKGIADSSEFGLNMLVIFTAVGIGFLLPLEISSSLWIYYVISLGMFMLAIWSAAGASVLSFPCDWMSESNFASSLGGGGLLAFSGSYLAKLAHDKWAEARGRGENAGAGRFLLGYLRSFGWGGALFLLSMIVAVAWLRWSGVGVFWALMFLAVVVLITVGLMRVVAEGGVYWFQTFTGPFHLARLAGGVPAVPASAVTPLMAVYSVLFLDIKTFIAPSIANGFKMQEETRAPRRIFHLAVVLSILVTVLVASVTLLCMAYRIGGNRADDWFFTCMPNTLFDAAQRLVSGAITRGGSLNWLFYVLGAGWVVLSILMRRRFFWWLHPIGFVMMVNPLMSQLWFSFFIGWFCKKLAVKYGGRHTFAKALPLFLGLIFGELLACFLWAVLAHALHLGIQGIDINRYNS